MGKKKGKLSYAPKNDMTRSCLGARAHRAISWEPHLWSRLWHGSAIRHWVPLPSCYLQFLHFSPFHFF